MAKKLLQRSRAAGPTPQELQTGGPGNDVFFVNDTSEVVLDSNALDEDIVYASVNWSITAGSHIEILSAAALGSTSPLVLVGNEFGQVIYGNAGANYLDGGLGNDTLVGFGGNDSYVVDDNGDYVTEAAGGGSDIVYVRGSFILGAGQEVEILAALSQAGTDPIVIVGNDVSQIIYGNAGNNYLDGGSGNDTLVGFGGNDSFLVDDNGDYVAEAAGGGSDIVYVRGSFILGAGQEVEILAAASQAGTDPIVIVGNEISQVIYGNAGANYLDGGSGNDTLVGFGGNDSFLVDDNGDYVTEAAGGGSDIVYVRGSFILGAGQEVEILAAASQAGTDPITIVGNEIGQVIYGNAGDNYLDGGSGTDVLQGFGGNDTYAVDSLDDLVVEAAGGGSDVVYARASYVLGAGQDVEILSAISQGATTAMDLTGNAIANQLYGNDGANTLDGGLGSDFLQGFGGADTFAFTTAPGAGNIDTILDFNVVDDTIQLGGAAGQPFAALATGALRVGTLVIGTAAADADDYLIYNSGTGALLFDADGNGGGIAVQVATLSTGLSLTVLDFVVTGLANNAPSVTSGGTASVAENSAASTIVYQTAATDADGDRISYALSGTDAGALTIDANGAVRLIAPANFEIKASYSFNVLVSDSGVTTTRAVTLSITDVNEGGPPTPIINETTSSNNSRLTAQVIDPGTFTISTNANLYNDDLPSATIVGSISAPGDVNGVSEDVDWYSITLTAGQQLILDVDGTSGLDSFLTLYGPDTSTVIGDNDDQIEFDPGSNQVVQHNWDSQIIFRAATSGTYYFSIASFSDAQGPTTSGAYQINVSVNNVPATPQQIMAEDIEALISGAAWNHTNLTFGFPNSASHYPSDFDEVRTTGANPPTFEAFTGNQQAATRSLLQLIANVSSLTFQEQTTQGPYTQDGTAAEADLRFAESSEAEVAYAYYPSNAGAGSEGGSAWFRHITFDQPFRGNYAWMGILHEVGHALGLKHGHEFPLAISADHDSLEYSVMTYRSFPGDNVSGGYGNEQWGYPQTLMMLDIAALQKIYDGANYVFNSGNSTYSWDSGTGEMSINGTGQGAPGNGSTPASNRILMTIWDGGGTDTYDLSNYVTGVTLDLRPGEWTTTSQDQLANLGTSGGPHFARGNIANALLFEGNTASAIENGKGGAAGDTLIANLVANQLTGNGGADIFKWMATGDAGSGGLADTVLDFVRDTDKIDFTALDAQPGTAGQQDFAFIGTGAFTNVAGQVRYDVTGGNANIFADVDGNGSADMQIILNGITTLAASDFNF